MAAEEEKGPGGGPECVTSIKNPGLIQSRGLKKQFCITLLGVDTVSGQCSVSCGYQATHNICHSVFSFASKKKTKTSSGSKDSRRPGFRFIVLVILGL